mmetsp:Transcript_16933/g.28694  ORF Transcript_16933/g.28694 Transcript_16933/m.28694 type:complete len:234 (+) Transcript_16933:87-788(+)
MNVLSDITHRRRKGSQKVPVPKLEAAEIEADKENSAGGNLDDKKEFCKSPCPNRKSTSDVLIAAHDLDKFTDAVRINTFEASLDCMSTTETVTEKAIEKATEANKRMTLFSIILVGGILTWSVLRVLWLPSLHYVESNVKMVPSGSGVAIIDVTTGSSPYYQELSVTASTKMKQHKLIEEDKKQRLERKLQHSNTVLRLALDVVGASAVKLKSTNASLRQFLRNLSDKLIYRQ